MKPTYRIKSFRSPFRNDKKELSGHSLFSQKQPLNFEKPFHSYALPRKSSRKSPRKSSRKNKKSIKKSKSNCKHDTNYQCSQVQSSRVINNKTESYSIYKCQCNNCGKEWEKEIKNGEVIFDSFRKDGRKKKIKSKTR